MRTVAVCLLCLAASANAFLFAPAGVRSTALAQSTKSTTQVEKVVKDRQFNELLTKLNDSSIRGLTSDDKTPTYAVSADDESKSE
ncbi:hypothetical protein JKP88DRAFT_347902 [Tribonema minus]|uniref:RxLR effector protein n=1 Tax=Tribonema minus TaxID=303371 RepID=A0A836CJN7_9STRA|nr:hypothetical protein JKP88DRAFT_347902 [Tribonema minus]